ncbi:MAG TPA: aldo/keto reductase [Propionibacteriaceae bacterium]
MPPEAGAYARPIWTGGPVGLPLGVGTWAWGDQGYWGFGKTFTSEDVAAAYRSSRTAGLTLFDTAEIYGNGFSEHLLGQLIHDHDDVTNAVVATKFAAIPWRVGQRSALRQALESSLKRLQAERVDLYQIHWSLPLLDDRAWLRAMADAVREGLVGAVGVSNYGPTRLRAAHRRLTDLGIPLATNQIEYSLLQRKPERSGLVELCRELDVTVIAYSPLAQGMLTGKYAPGRPPPGIRRLRYQRFLSRLPALIATLTQLGADHGGKTPAQVALNWLIAHGTVPIPGAKNADQAQHNAGAVGWSLTPDQVQALDQLRR